MKLSLIACVSAAVLGLAASQSLAGPPPAGAPGVPPAGPPPVAAPGPGGPGGLFVSPCGRPYRAEAGQPYPVGVWFAAADTNKDGKLDKAELRADALIFFRALDQDRNGVVEGMEITFYERRILPEMLQNQEVGALDRPAELILAQYGGGGGMGGMGQPGGLDGPPVTDGDEQQQRKRNPALEVNLQGAAPYNFLREPEPVTSSDSDFNHRITADEFAAASDRRFKLLDKKALGYLTLDTLPLTHEQLLQDDHGGGRGRGKRRPKGA